MNTRCPTCGSSSPAKSAVKAALGVAVDAPEEKESGAEAKDDLASRRDAGKPSFAERMANKYRFARRG